MGSASCTHDRCAQRLESNSSGKNRNCTLPKNTYMSGILALYSLLLGRKFSIIVSKEFSRYMAAPLGKPQEGCAASSPPRCTKRPGKRLPPRPFAFSVPFLGEFPDFCLSSVRPRRLPSSRHLHTRRALPHPRLFARGHRRIPSRRKSTSPQDPVRGVFCYFHCQSSKHRRPLRLCPCVLPTVMRPLPRSAITSPAHTSSAARRHSACRRLTSPAAMSAAA